ncbi:hypothetical protein P3X46_002657 [Hevea brasiliensis]|uniref:F-box domain-containing protein n=1 Tax=Hevea brasiliensis TaxID=3981 RepID=A0ABQ9N5F8_HEVBR|nr:hypothetical protein P3X46_002657 [Hevea brasiliensis]
MGGEEKINFKNSQMVRESYKEEELQLIPGLLDEIAMECLVRVPYQFHSNMKSNLVCLVRPLSQSDSTDSLSSATPTTTVAAAVTNKEDKQIHSPPLFGLSIYNTSHDSWQRTRPQGGIPMFCQCLALQSSGKVLLLGGWDPSALEPVLDVYIMDLIGAGGCRWRRGAPMSVSRSFFACAVVGPSKVYVAGGHDGQKNTLQSAKVYDVDKNEWQKLLDLIKERDECRSWSKVDGVWPFLSTSPRGATATVSINRNQYQWWCFLGGDQYGEVKENENMRWEIVNSLPLPECIIRTNPCVISLGQDAQGVKRNNKNNNKQRVFVVSGSGRRSPSSSSLSCSQCDYKGAFILDRDCNNGNTKWNHIHTPAGFSGFPFSACNLSI